ADAERQLEDGAAELDRSAAELERGAKQLEQGRKDFESGRKQLLDQLGAKDLASAKQTLQAQREEAEQGIAALEEAQAGAQQIVDGKAALAQSKQEAEQGRAEWTSGSDQLLSALAAQGMPAGSVQEACAGLEQAIAQQQAAGAPEQALAPLQEALAQAQRLAAADEELTRGEQALAQAQDELAGAEQQLLAGLAAQGLEATDAAAAIPQLEARKEQASAGVAQIDEGLDGIARLETAQGELDENAKKIADGRRQIASGRSQLESGQREFEEQRADAYRQLDEAQDQLDDARRELEDGLAEYEDGKREAQEELDDAKRQLDDAQKKVDELELPDIYMLDRSKSEGAVTYHDDSNRIDSIARVFPFMFFLVAALVALTTMTRMVEDDRILIGTYKALGYSTARIASKYLWYAGLASATGAVLGILALSQVLPYIITSSYAIIYTVPLHPFPLPIDLPIALASGGLGVGVTLVATWAAVVASLREVPATLMLPRAPASGKRILLERAGPVWRRLSFSWKVTCRNLFRYKRRLAMTVVGISGCTALLLVGFGLHDAIWDIIDCQYGPIIHYDTTIGLDDDATEIDVAKVIDLLEDTGEVSDIERVQQENMQVGTQEGGSTMRVQVIIPRTASELERVVTLRNRQSHEPIAFGDSTVVVTEKIALKYHIAPGDEILLYDQDTIGNVKGSGHRLKVSGVAENYVGNLVYVGRDAWRAVDDAQPVFSTIYATTNPSEEVRSNLADELRERDDVSTVIFSDETINLYRNMLSVVDFVVVVLIVSAGLLAFIVLYNLTNINVEERVREIASLKVLGFTKGEVYAYIYREIALLAILGDVLGMALGTYLASFVITTAEVDYVMFGRTIHLPSYAYSFVITLVFVGLVMLIMRRKLDRVDMVESLKSVD
ncbi:MAG: FtsX-like permease family protein, partial [Coriobacteriales bacterium]|nr:FtsX-like permease family protein [Coriobacteriales bacterium]